MARHDIFAKAKPLGRRTWAIAAAFLLVGFMVLGQVIGIIPGVILGVVDLENPMGSWKSLAYTLVAAFGVTTLLVFLWTWFFERRSLASIGLNAKFLSRFFKGYLVGLGLLGGVVALIWATGGYQIEASGSLALASLIPVAWLMFGFVIQGSAEEIVFRGWFMSLIASRHGLVLAIVLNSALFGLLHAGNIEFSRELVFGLGNIVLVGIFLSLYAAKEGSLWGVCGWHAAWNWLLGTGFGLPVSGQDAVVDAFVVDLMDTADAPWWLTGGAFGPEASAATSLVLLGGILFVGFRGKFAKYPTPDSTSNPMPSGDASESTTSTPPATASGFVGDIPQNYDEGLGPHIFIDYAKDIASRASKLGGNRVLELAAGTGIVSRQLRDTLPAHVELLVTDLNPPMLAIASQKFNDGEAVSFRPIDAMNMSLENASSDLIVCQFGVMFFPGKVESFREARRVLASGGNFLFSVWGAIEANPFSQVASDTAAAMYPDDPPGFYKVPFGYHDTEQVRADLAEAGFVDIRHQVIALDKTVEDWALFARGLVLGNPLIEEIRQRGGHTPEDAMERLTKALIERFGEAPSQMPLEAIVFEASSPA